jgi:AcrR family transcriptional regulator
MAAYYYVPNKDGLLDAIVEAVMSDIDLAMDDPSSAPEDRVMQAARAYRDALLAHVNALPIVLSRGPNTGAAMRPVEFLVGILREAGLSPAQAVAGMNAIAATVRGTVGMVADQSAMAALDEAETWTDPLPAEKFPYLREAATCQSDFLGADFEFGIRALARGLLQSVDPAGS